MQFEGLETSIKDGNVLDVHAGSKFLNSKISIDGRNNTVTLEKALVYRKLVINLKGDNKTIHISESDKNINFLKIVSIRGNNQYVKIGKNFSLGGMELQLNDGDEGVSIGENCLFSWGIKMRTSDGHSIIDLKTGRAINLPENIEIRDRVWVGEDVRFLKGSGIPTNSVVGAGSIVTRSFIEDGSNFIVAGVPAKIVKYDIDWHREMPRIFNLKNSEEEN